MAEVASRIPDDKPGSASQIRILDANVCRAPYRGVLPEGGKQSKVSCDGEVVGIRRPGTAVADDGTGLSCVGSVRKKMSSEVICGVVNREAC